MGLLGPTLRGLARFSTFMGLEYFQDVISILLRVLHMPGLLVSDQVQTLLTLTDILHRQMDALKVDRQQMHDEVLRVLLRAPLQPLEERWDDIAPQADEADVRSPLDAPAPVASSSGGDAVHPDLEALVAASGPCSAAVAEHTTKLLLDLLCGPRNTDYARLSVFLKVRHRNGCVELVFHGL